MRWNAQSTTAEQDNALPGLATLNNLVRSVQTPEFAGVTFHEILAKSALNRVPGQSSMPFGWTVNPYRGCSHACVYCFARPTHTYLDFDAGKDFDTQVVVKVNVAEVLEREVRKASWGRHPVALGTNTDPYQRAEGKYQLMPGIIDALAGSGTPLSVLTKGVLLRRDIPKLVEASQQVPVDIAMSIAIFDPELQRSIEPGTPTAAARLATVRAATDAGLNCSVFMMPILPGLTDSAEHLDDALSRIKAAGATSVLYTALHLRPGVKPWFLEWLRHTHPELIGLYARLFPGAAAYAPEGYRRWLAARIKPLIASHGLRRGLEDPATGGVRSRALDSAAVAEGSALQAARRSRVRMLPATSEPRTGLPAPMSQVDGRSEGPVFPSLELGPQPTLF
ncbi:Rv2578c family radical SAM protein [Lysinibacter cavernae]|uniref:DNA repair photolyase n=1 Tax=Lysinibacter cavernae TaxID=1640652 RepID=A0A7X5TS65_9MICO|nr:Rv2578c family radical SAM protein [Lysinibacter cavernae]NIH53136.1 DNA repair photolyase [Lysinibacter cavernae]